MVIINYIHISEYRWKYANIGFPFDRPQARRRSQDHPEPFCLSSNNMRTGPPTMAVIRPAGSPPVMSILAMQSDMSRVIEPMIADTGIRTLAFAPTSILAM